VHVETFFVRNLGGLIHARHCAGPAREGYKPHAGHVRGPPRSQSGSGPSEGLARTAPIGSHERSRHQTSANPESDTATVAAITVMATISSFKLG